MTFSWNVETKNLHANESLLTKVREQLGTLQPFVKDYPPNSVHLLIELERDLKQDRYIATLTLRLPRNILRSRQTADDAMKAFDGALQALRHQLESQKQDARGQRLPKHARTEKEQWQSTEFAEKPQAAGAGPQNYQEVVREFLEHNYNRLLYHVRRHIHEYEATGDLPQGAVDPRDIVDEVARQAEARVSERPPMVEWLVWVFHLLHEELRRQRDFYRQKEAGEIPTEQPRRVPELSEEKLQPLERIVQKEIEPQVIRTEDVLQGSEMRPDEFVAQKERIEQLLPQLPHWTWIEREVFELYFIEGFEPDEIAKAMDQPADRIREIVDELRDRVREQLLAPEEATA
jgi:RNA polymerase sigma factor (sigma-70 family)